MNFSTLLNAAASTTTTTVASKSSSSGETLVFGLLIVLVLGWMLFIRPRQQKIRREQMERRNKVEIGDTVIAGGMIGTLISNDGKEVMVRVSPEQTFSFHPYYVQAIRAVDPTWDTKDEVEDTSQELATQDEQNPTESDNE